MRNQTIVIGIGAIVVIAAIVWMVRENKETFIAQIGGKCPRGTLLQYERTPICIPKKRYNPQQQNDFVASQFPHWGWGPNAGLRCKNDNNTGCDTVWHNGKLYIKK